MVAGSSPATTAKFFSNKTTCKMSNFKVGDIVYAKNSCIPLLVDNVYDGGVQVGYDVIDVGNQLIRRYRQYNNTSVSHTPNAVKAKMQTVTPMSENGKTLRDEFAMSALQGLLQDKERVKNYTIESIVKLAYEYADAMIEARKQSPSI